MLGIGYPANPSKLYQPLKTGPLDCWVIPCHRLLLAGCVASTLESVDRPLSPAASRLVNDRTNPTKTVSTGASISDCPLAIADSSNSADMADGEVWYSHMQPRPDTTAPPIPLLQPSMRSSC